METDCWQSVSIGLRPPIPLKYGKFLGALGVFVSVQMRKFLGFSHPVRVGGKIVVTQNIQYNNEW